MNNIYEVAIIGGGASGLLSAVELLSGNNALSGEQVIILERNDRVGKKLVATGNGQGNLTNEQISKENYHGNKGFITAFFPLLNKIDVRKYLEGIGIFTFVQEDGKVFPISLQANSVLDNLRYFLDSKNCQVKTNFYVDKVEKKEDYFLIFSNGNCIKAKYVVCAFGGSAGKQYGTDGSSYRILENFGHKLTSLSPSLVQIKAELREFKGLKGIKEKAKVYALDGEQVLSSVEGDLLFTEYGLSGSSIFKLVGLQDAKNPKVRVELLPWLSLEELENIIKKRKELKIFPNEDVLLGIVNKQLGRIICKKYFREEDIAYAVKNLEFKVTGNLGFNYAQVTKGGIDTNNVNPFTMQSKLVKNLYLTGELLDVDGDCGGYNLTFAFISGILSAKSIKEKKGE